MWALLHPMSVARPSREVCIYSLLWWQLPAFKPGTGVHKSWPLLLWCCEPKAMFSSFKGALLWSGEDWCQSLQRHLSFPVYPVEFWNPWMISLLSVENPTLFCKHVMSHHHEFQQGVPLCRSFCLSQQSVFLIFGVFLIIVNQQCWEWGWVKWIWGRWNHGAVPSLSVNIQGGKKWWGRI